MAKNVTKDFFYVSQLLYYSSDIETPNIINFFLSVERLARRWTNNFDCKPGPRSTRKTKGTNSERKRVKKLCAYR